MLLYDSTYSTFYVDRKIMPTIFPVTLSEIKRFLRIKNSFDDELLNNLISIASEYAQWYMEKSLMRQTWKITCYGYIPNKIYLAFGPVLQVNSVTISYQDNKNEELLDKKYYYVDTVREYVHINFPQHHNDYRIHIAYDAGYNDSNLIPLQIKKGIVQHIALTYKNREVESPKDLLIIKEIYSPFCKLKIVL